MAASGSYLLDTHTLIWWWLGDPALSKAARTVIAERAGAVHVSAVAGIEIALKVRSGKLPALAEILETYDLALATDVLQSLPVKHGHAIRAGLMHGDHRDPFDRIIAAQAQIEGLTVITRDREIARFGCEVLW